MLNSVVWHEECSNTNSCLNKFPCNTYNSSIMQYNITFEFEAKYCILFVLQEKLFSCQQNHSRFSSKRYYGSKNFNGLHKANWHAWMDAFVQNDHAEGFGFVKPEPDITRYKYEQNVPTFVFFVQYFTLHKIINLRRTFIILSSDA